MTPRKGAFSPSVSNERLCLLQVHAHPDDEASKGAGTTARYAAEGVHTVLVSCTGGEAGDILNPAADTPEVRADIRAVRLRELADSVRILGYGSAHMLGYRDSGMPDTEANAHPESFAQAPLDEAIGRLVRIVRAERPQVIITYGDDHSGYPHPDHLRVTRSRWPPSRRPATRSASPTPARRGSRSSCTTPAGRGIGSRRSTRPSWPGARRAPTPTGSPSGTRRCPTGR